ncbi:hypothetical protein B0H11DRAFT_1976206, partial [Mycena galericulata]
MYISSIPSIPRARDPSVPASAPPILYPFPAFDLDVGPLPPIVPRTPAPNLLAFPACSAARRSPSPPSHRFFHTYWSLAPSPLPAVAFPASPPPPPSIHPFPSPPVLALLPCFLHTHRSFAPSPLPAAAVPAFHLVSRFRHGLPLPSSFFSSLPVLLSPPRAPTYFPASSI